MSKKKLFISCPMRGRAEENIRKTIEKMHKIAEIVFEDELEVIPSCVEDTPPEDSRQAVWYLGRSIQNMAKADYYIGIFFKGAHSHRGCAVENKIAREYCLKRTFVDCFDVAPDLISAPKAHYMDYVRVV